LLVVNGDQRVESNSNIEGTVTCTSIQREVALSRINPNEEIEITELFHIKIQLKKKKTDCLFDPKPQSNLI
jgi:hypothetical protein